MREQARVWRRALVGEALEAQRARHRQASATYRAVNPELCNQRIRAWKQANPDAASEGVNRRRAWKLGNGAPEKFTRTEIGERDGWICGICGEPVDRTLRFPDKMSPSLDHVIPLSLGGEHSPANSRIAHWICNVRRGIGMRKDAGWQFPSGHSRAGATDARAPRAAGRDRSSPGPALCCGTPSG
jgi:5-methylcytosine-specific restriction endonuclease McrA